MTPLIPIATKMAPLGQSDGHGTRATMLWSSTPLKLYNAGVIDARAMSIVRDVGNPLPSVTTTNSNPTSVAPADPVMANKLLHSRSIGRVSGNQARRAPRRPSMSPAAAIRAAVRFLRAARSC